MCPLSIDEQHTSTFALDLLMKVISQPTHTKSNIDSQFGYVKSKKMIKNMQMNIRTSKDSLNN